MPKQSNQKLKLMYIYKLLTQYTNEQHTMTVNQIIEELSKVGITAERKSIYDDIELLLNFGIDICTVRKRSNEYFVASNSFELPELKLLVDSVQSAKFITDKKTIELIGKIEKLTNVYDAEKLNRQVYVFNRAKTLNEHIYYNVDRIHDAIIQNKQISFKYFEYTIEKKKQYRKDGKLYTETPIALTWADENYYLITYKDKYKSFVHYRVDKMENISILNFQRLMPASKFNLAEYTKSVFSMFGGVEENVCVEFDNSLIGVVLDRFGMEVSIQKSINNANAFTARLKVAVSKQFLSWIASFGGMAKIVSPQKIADEYASLLQNALESR